MSDEGQLHEGRLHFRGGQLDGIKASSPTDGELYADWDPKQDAYIVSDEDGEPQGVIKSAPGDQFGLPRPMGPPVKWYKNPRLFSYSVMLLALLVFEVAVFFTDLSVKFAIVSGAFLLSMVAFWAKA